MSNRNRTTLPQRLPILSDNDRIILNIYLNMYNQTVRDIELSYQHIDLLYNNLDLLYNSLESTREIINTITGVSGLNNSSTDQETPLPSFGTFLRPTAHSYYRTADDNNLSLSSRLYLVDFARRLLSSYNDDTTTTTTPATTTNNRGAEERDRRRVRQRTEVNTRRRPNANNSNNDSINFDSIASGITRRYFPGLSSFYDNVPVYPSEEQITNGTRRLIFSSIDIPLNICCPITLERFENDTEVLQILGCRHIFNPTSLQRWFQNNVRCPICRYDIRDYIPTSNRRRRYFQDEEEPSQVEPTQEETKEDEEEEEQTRNTSSSSQTSGSTLRTNTPEPEPRNTAPEPTDRSEFITNLTSVTENLLTDLISSSFPNNHFSFNGTTYSVDVSNNEIVFQGYILPNQDE